MMDQKISTLDLKKKEKVKLCGRYWGLYGCFQKKGGKPPKWMVYNGKADQNGMIWVFFPYFWSGTTLISCQRRAKRSQVGGLVDPGQAFCLHEICNGRTPQKTLSIDHSEESQLTLLRT